MTDLHEPPSNPFLNLPVRVVSGEIPVSTCSSKRKPKSVPPMIRTLISRLGLRYEPSVRADLDAHAARIALLAEDLSEARADLLEAAIERWVGFKPYLPKANELIAIMTAIAEQRNGAPGKQDLEARVAELNAMPLAAMQNWRFFVTYRVENNAKQWFIDRREDRDHHGKPEWKPAPGEMEAIHAKVAEYVAKGWSQAEFAEHVKRTRGNI